MSRTEWDVKLGLPSVRTVVHLDDCLPGEMVLFLTCERSQKVNDTREWYVWRYFNLESGKSGAVMTYAWEHDEFLRYCSNEL